MESNLIMLNTSFSSGVCDLSGIWQFTFVKSPISEINISDLPFDSFAAVPGCYDLLPQCKFKRGTGVYRRSVEFSGGPCELTLHGIGLRGAVYWDGNLIGEIDAPFSKRVFRFDSGSAGSHELVIAVNNEFDTSLSSLFKPNYDFYAHGGIYRKVTIAPASETFAQFLKVLPLDLEEGTVEVSVSLGGATDTLTQAELFWDSCTTPDLLKLEKGSGSAVFKVPGHKLWTPENPHLHKLTLTAGDCKVVTTFGFRKITVADGKLFLNGKLLKIAGTNRHDAHPDFGYAVPADIRLRDLLMLKAQGFNCIRGCHYPQDEEFLDMCDNLGMMVWEESLAWGNREGDLADPLFCQRQLRETERMAIKSINHPSVIMWGFLNECGSDTEPGEKLIGALAALLHRIDPSRPVTYGGNRLTRDISLHHIDIISFNTYPCWYGEGEDQYFDAACLKRHLDSLAAFASAPEYINKPVIISEIGAEALPGDHSGMRWSEEYQASLLSEVMRYVLESDRCTGTFLWQFCDIRTYITNCCQHRSGGFNHKGMVDYSRMPKLSWKVVGDTIKEYFPKEK